MDIIFLNKFIMSRVICILLCFFLFNLPGFVNAKDLPDTFSIASEPSWVNLQKSVSDGVVDSENISGGVSYLLVDEQVNTISGYSNYSRIVSKVTNSEGVQSSSAINLEYNPEFEKIILHRIVIVRNKKQINKLKKENIDVFRREKQMDYQIYDGRLTANIVLNDIREGDIIDYSYTITGRNPATVGLGTGYFDTQWSVPVAKQYRRLIWPRSIPVYIKYFVRKIEPKINRSNDLIEYVWEENNVPIKKHEENTPKWHDIYSWIQFSETDSWANVKERGREFYSVSAEDKLAVKNIVNEIKKGIKDKKSQLELAIYYVQDKIRYTGIEIGVNSFIPYPTKETLNRRYGDCKDKTLLFLSILAGLGIEASPVLVNTRSNDDLNRYLPSISLFDHMIARVKFEGQYYWIDLTKSHQSRSLEHMYQPDYGFALVIDKSDDILVDMGAGVKNKLTVQISETYDLSQGLDKPAKLTIQSKYFGQRAESFRRNLASSNKNNIADEYKDYMGNIFPSLIVRDELRIEDDVNLNQITVHEFYSIPGLWKKDQDGTEYLSVYQYEINSYLKKPSSIDRASPYEISHPVHVEQITSIYMPEEWNVTQAKKVIDSNVISFKSDFYGQNNSIHKRSIYKTISDTVKPSEIARYIDDISKISDQVDIYLYKEPASSFFSIVGELYKKFNFRYLLLFVALPAAFLSFLIFNYFYKGNQPWLTFWFHPKNTISYVYSNPSLISSVFLIFVTGVYYLIEQFFMGALGGKYPDIWIWLSILLLGPVIGFFQVYLWSWLLSYTGKWLDSPVEAKELRIAVIWSSVPGIFSILIFISLAILMKGNFFIEDTTVFNNNFYLLSYSLGAFFVLLLLAIWWGVAQIAMLAEMQNFSFLKTFGHICLTGLFVTGVLLVPIIAISLVVGVFT